MSLKINYMGRMGNNMFQYAFGPLLAEELGLRLENIPDSLSPFVAVTPISGKSIQSEKKNNYLATRYETSRCHKDFQEISKTSCC